MNERREYLRYDCHVILAITSEQSKVVEFEGQAKNLSQGGIIFSSTVELEVNQPVKIAFEHNDNYIYAEGTILRKDEESGQYVYAAEFPVRLSEDDVQALLNLTGNEGRPN